MSKKQTAQLGTATAVDTNFSRPIREVATGQPVPPEKALEKKLAGGDDLAFDSRMTNAAPAVASGAEPQSIDAKGADPKEFARELAKEMAALMPNQQVDMVAQATLIGTVVDRIIRGLREPSEEQKEADRRRKANRAIAIKEQAEMIEAMQAFQDGCPHEEGTSDGKTHTLIVAVHNFADGVLRGICQGCRKLIEPGDPHFGTVVAQHNQAVRSTYAGA